MGNSNTENIDHKIASSPLLDSYFILHFHNPVIEFNPETLEVLRFNLQAASFLSIDNNESQLGNLIKIFSEETISNLLLHLEKAVKSGKDKFRTTLRLNFRNVPTEATVVVFKLHEQQVAYLVLEDISEDISLQHEYEFRLEFHNLISHISHKLHNASPEKIDDVIEESLEIIGQYTNADRALVYLFKNEGALADNTHEWVKEGYPSIKPWRQNVSSSELPWLVDHLRRFETVVVLDPNNIPEEAVAERAILQKMGIKSSCATPIRSGNNLLGMLALNSREYQKLWNPASLKLMELLARVFANAIVRRNDSFKIRHLSQNLMHTSRIAPIGTWQWDIISGKLFWSDKYYEILGFEPYSIIPTFDAELAVIHPDERSGWMSAIEQSILEQSAYMLKTRLLMPNSEVKHVLVAGEGEFSGSDLVSMSGAIIDITEYEKSQEELKESQQKFQQLVDSMNEGLIYVDNEGQVVYANEAASRITGYSADELISRKDIDLLIGDKDRMNLEEKRLDRLKNISENYEVQLKTKSGEIIWARISASPVYDGSKNVIGSHGIIMNITKQKELQTSLIQSTEKWKSLVENIPEYIGLADKDYTLSFVNRAFNHVAKEKLVGLSLVDLVDEAYKKPLKKLLDTMMKDGISKGLEVSTTDKFDVKHWFITHFSPVVVDGKFESIIAIASEITEIKAIETSLRESNEKWRSLFDNAPDMILVLSGDITVKVQNSLADDHLNGNHSGKQFLSLFQIEQKEALGKAIQSLKKTGRSQVVEACITKNQLQQCFVFRFGLVNKTERQGDILAIATDITRQKESQQKLNYYYSRLRELTDYLERVRNDEKKRISMEIHDGLGQELTSIKLDLHLLQEMIQRDLKESRLYEFLNDKLEALVTKTGATIETMRKISYQLMPVILDKMGLEPALEWLVRGFQDTNNIRCRLIIDLNGRKLNNNVSSTIYRIVQEALTNISKHAGASSVAISLRLSKNILNLVVKDNGKGISTSDIEKVGSIGLFSIQERVRNLNGVFNIEGTPNKGTAIIIKIPINKQKL